MAEPKSWADYIEAEAALLLKQAGPDLALAMVHSRAIECPEVYAKSRTYKHDLAQAEFGVSKQGYWMKVALRALVLLNVPVEEREKLIAEAAERNRKAREAVRKSLKAKPGGPKKPVDLSGLVI